MYGAQLAKYYLMLRGLGLVRSKREFAMRWLGRGGTYLRDIEFKRRLWRPVTSITTARLRANLISVAARSPRSVVADIARVLAAMERDATVTRTMEDWRR